MKPIFIIEHLEPKLWPWCIIEYKSISKIIGRNNLIFTNVSKKDLKKLEKFGKVFTKSVKNLNIDLHKACVLDPLAQKALEPHEAGKFQYYIFGGILGDEKLNGRTSHELTKFLSNSSKRNIGKAQFSTDNAVYVTSQIINGKSQDKIEFQDSIEIPINKIESVILPYRYPLVSGKPRISPKLIDYLKNKKSF